MPKTKEIWKDIPNYKGYYQVSNLGRVRSLRIVSYSYNKKRTEPLVLSPCVNAYGYHSVTISKNGKLRKVMRISRLVLFTFAGKPKSKEYHAAHLNGKRSDNRLKNLKWKTSLENEADKKKHGTYLYGETGNGAILKEKDVVQILKLLNKKKTLTYIAEKFNISIPTVSCIKHNKIWRHLSRRDQ